MKNNRNEIIEAINKVCARVEEAIGNEEKLIEINSGCILIGSNIDEYKIESVDYTLGSGEISVEVKFHVKNSILHPWYGKFYFYDGNTVRTQN